MSIKSLNKVLAEVEDEGEGQGEGEGEGEDNPGEQQDDEQSAVISCDMTLFIRLLEVAREDLQTDVALHELVERCSQQMAIKNKPLTMDDYDMVCPLVHEDSGKEQASSLPTKVKYKGDSYSLERRGKSLNHGGETGRYTSTKALWYDPLTKKITPD